jgi:DNA polymerase-3 subunit beta
MTTADFTTAVDGVAYAASTDDSRPTLTGIEAIISSAGILFASTDGYRLSKCTIATPVAMDEGMTTTVIIPAVSLTKAAAATKGYEEVEIGIAANLNLITFTYTAPGTAMVVASGILDAKYPDYRAIIPKSHNTKAVVPAEEFRVALKTAMITARDAAGLIRLALMNGKITVSATTSESAAETEIDAKLEGNDLDIAFNGKYLLQSLASFSGDNIVLTATNPTRPISMYAEKTGPDALLAVIMPMNKER